MQEVLLKRYATIIEGRQTVVANVIEKSVDLHALRVIGSSGYQKTVKYLWKGWLVQDDNDATTFVDYKQKANPSYWVHLNPDRMRAPVYQNATQVIISLVYLGLYTGAINTVNPTGDLDITEVLMYIFTFGFLCDEFSKFWKVGRFYLGFWNVFNLILYSLLTISFVTRCIALSHPIQGDHDGQRERFNELSYNFLAFSAPMFWGRLLLFLDTFRFFGAKHSCCDVGRARVRQRNSTWFGRLNSEDLDEPGPTRRCLTPNVGKISSMPIQVQKSNQNTYSKDTEANRP